MKRGRGKIRGERRRGEGGEEEGEGRRRGEEEEGRGREGGGEGRRRGRRRGEGQGGGGEEEEGGGGGQESKGETKVRGSREQEKKIGRERKQRVNDNRPGIRSGNETTQNHW